MKSRIEKEIIYSKDNDISGIAGLILLLLLILFIVVFPPLEKWIGGFLILFMLFSMAYYVAQVIEDTLTVRRLIIVAILQIGIFIIPYAVPLEDGVFVFWFCITMFMIEIITTLSFNFYRWVFSKK